MATQTKPILMSAPMVRALLDGRKTQTRRVMKPQPVLKTPRNFVFPNDAPKQFQDGDDIREASPYGPPGMLLWVRETWCPVNDRPEGGEFWVDYRATPWDDESYPAGWHNEPDHMEALRWRLSIHMPRWASRLTLEVTDVWAERVQDISPEGARAEGVEATGGEVALRDQRLTVHQHAFANTWDAINAKRGHGWDANPWVWAVAFRVHHANVDDVLAREPAQTSAQAEARWECHRFS